MKKIILSCLAVAATFVMFSCKSTESSYRAAYEKAKAQEAVAQQTSEPVSVQPVVTTQTPANVDNSNVRSERLNVMNGGTLKAYNVVCGSFKSLDNANNLRNTLVNAGYTAQVAQNPETGMYRVRIRQTQLFHATSSVQHTKMHGFFTEHTNRTILNKL